MSKTWNNCINKNIICEYAILFKKGGGKKKIVIIVISK